MSKWYLVFHFNSVNIYPGTHIDTHVLRTFKFYARMPVVNTTCLSGASVGHLHTEIPQTCLKCLFHTEENIYLLKFSSNTTEIGIRHETSTDGGLLPTVDLIPSDQDLIWRSCRLSECCVTSPIFCCHNTWVLSCCISWTAVRTRGGEREPTGEALPSNFSWWDRMSSSASMVLYWSVVLHKTKRQWRVIRWINEALTLCILSAA